MSDTLSEAKLKFLMQDKRYWHPRHADPAFQAMITQGFKRLYPTAGRQAESRQGTLGGDGPVHVDAHRRTGIAVSEYYRSRPRQGGDIDAAAKTRHGTRSPLPRPDRDDVTPKEIFAATNYDPNGPGERENALRNPYEAWLADNIATNASHAAVREYPTSRRWNDEGDAYRHALWSYEMTREFGPAAAKNFGDSHERTRTNKPSETAMDLYNNQVGRDLAQDPANAGRNGKEVIREAARNGKLRTRPYPVPADADHEGSYSLGHPGSRHLK